MYIRFFNINLAFGPGHCLVFFYQILGCYVIYYFGTYIGNPVNPFYSVILNIFGLMVFHNPVLEIVALTSSLTPNPTPNPYSFPMLILSYIKVVLAILYYPIRYWDAMLYIIIMVQAHTVETQLISFTQVFLIFLALWCFIIQY